MINLSNRWARRLGFTWLLLLSGSLIGLSIVITRMDAQRRQDAPDAQIAELQVRTAALETFKTAFDTSPTKVTEADFQQARERWQQRWDTLNQRLQDAATAADLQALQSHVEILSLQITAEKPKTAPARTRPARPRAVKVTPNFQPLGIESRGGERFLAIRPSNETGLAQVQLLRVGESTGPWKLLALEARAALFTVNGQTQRLALPQE